LGLVALLLFLLHDGFLPAWGLPLALIGKRWNWSLADISQLESRIPEKAKQHYSVWTIALSASSLRLVKNIRLEQFGRNVRCTRISLGITQEILAEKAGCHANYVGGIERGERNCTIDVAASIAVALGVSLSELLAGVL
jgi:DNA-binding XRE family transcriptional regulator